VDPIRLPTPGRPASVVRRDLLVRSAAWLLVITVVGLGGVPVGRIPAWLPGVVLAAGYGALATTVTGAFLTTRAGGEERMRARFEHIVAPLRRELEV